MASAFSSVTKLLHRWVEILRQRRHRQQLARQLPDIIRRFNNLLSGGASLQRAIHQLASEAPVPGRSVFVELRNAQLSGVPPAHTLERLLNHTDDSVLELFLTTLAVSLTSGGRIGDLLQECEKIATARIALHEKLRAATAQGRVQAVVMALLPPLILVALQWIDPAYLTPLWSTTIGRAVLAAALAGNLLGYLWIRRLCRGVL